MKRLAVGLGLVALVVGCAKKEEPPPREYVPPSSPPACTEGVLEDGELDAQGRADYLIKYRDGDALEQGAEALERRDVQLRSRLRHLNVLAARLRPEDAAALARERGVEYVERDRTVHALGLGRVPLPPLALMRAGPPVQAGSVDEYTWGLQAVQAPLVWDADADGQLDADAPAGQGVKVCIIDSGIDPRHPELAVPVVGQRDFVANDDDATDFGCGQYGSGHGTHVAGTIAAQLASAGATGYGFTMSRNGVVGVAPAAQLLIARALNSKGSGRTSDIDQAMDWCAQQGARVISMSLGSASSSTSEWSAVQRTLAKDIVLFAAAGNDGQEQTEKGTHFIAFPGGYKGVIAVGSVNRKLELSTFSQYGTPSVADSSILVDGVALVAPGEEVLSTFLQGTGLDYGLEINGARTEAGALTGSGYGEVTGPVVTCGWGESDTSCHLASVPDGGFVAYVDRGTPPDWTSDTGILFSEKVARAQKQGARAVIIGNNEVNGGLGAFTLGDGGYPPTLSVTYDEGQQLKAQPGATAHVALAKADYVQLQGTSMATPHAAAVGALVLSARPDLTVQQVREALTTSARDLGASGKDERYGYGLVQAPAAVTAARALPVLPRPDGGASDGGTPDGGTPDAGP